MKFRKLVLYDLKTDPLEKEFVGKLSAFADSVQIVLAKKEYAGSLKTEQAQGADALVTRLLDFYDKRIFENGTLKFIATMHTDYSNFDLNQLKKNKIALTHVSSYSTEAVAELTISALLNISRRTHEAMNFVKGGKWGFEKFMGFELKGKTLGIIGLGRIGGRVAEIVHAFGMRVIYFSQAKKTDWEKKGIRFVPLEELLKQSDVVSLHCSLNHKTEKILNKSNLVLMKKGAVLLDAGRSELVDLDSVYLLCKQKQISAWFEAIEDEKVRKRFAKLENVFLTPHFGWMTQEAQQRLREITLSNIREYLNGKSQNRIV